MGTIVAAGTGRRIEERSSAGCDARRTVDRRAKESGVRVMCTVSAWPTHYFPLVPQLWALQAAGHEVRVVCAPSQVPVLTRAGLIPVPVLTELEIAFLARLKNVWDAQAGTWPYPWHPPHPVTGEDLTDLAQFDFATFARANQQKIAGPVRRSGEAAVQFAREWRPDLVLHEPLSLEGLLAAKVTGVPAVLHLWGPVGTHETDPDVRGVAEYPAGSFPGYGVGEVSLDTVGHVIDPCPPDLAPPVKADRLPVRYVPYNGTGEVPDWLWGEPVRPRVCVVWGNSLTRMFGSRSLAIPLVLEALSGLDVEVVVCAGQRDVGAVAGSSDRVRVCEQLPLHLLLPSCAVVVHHGGAGCLMTALAAGVPQVAIPTGMDQPANARRMAAAGLGYAIPRAGADAASVRAAVGDVLDTVAYRQRAAEVREQMLVQPTPAQLVGELEKLAGAG
jgi:UDP:flavonoid glycosyltransferase YjiC (YdhE family)